MSCLKNLIFGTCLLFMLGCQRKASEDPSLQLDDIFHNPSVTVASVTQSYQSDISATAITDMDETILCMSTKIQEKSYTYFIQPDQVDLKALSFKYKGASIVDMKYALLFEDIESKKSTLIYLPGKFPIDSLRMKPDVMIPVMGISKYHSELEKISSRWTEIVCKCVGMREDSIIYKNRTIHQCDSGGPGYHECSLATEGSVTVCQTECRLDAIACCWFEF